MNIGQYDFLDAGMASRVGDESMLVRSNLTSAQYHFDVTDKKESFGWLE